MTRVFGGPGAHFAGEVKSDKGFQAAAQAHAEQATDRRPALSLGVRAAPGEVYEGLQGRERRQHGESEGGHADAVFPQQVPGDVI